MQSQQKRVKWSRGETAEALEERTDTGITIASVELMENCIPDIYGNISRRPALSIVELASSYSSTVGGGDDLGFRYEEGVKVIPYYITQDDFILVAIYAHGAPELLRLIKDSSGNYKIVYKTSITGIEFPYSGIYTDSGWEARPISYAQQNNFLIIGTQSNIYKLQISNVYYSGTYAFTPTCSLFNFSAGWYAPQGTQTKQVSSSDITGLNFDASTIASYTYTNSVGDTTVYSWINTSVADSYTIDAFAAKIPVGSIVQFPNNGAYMRIEGYVVDNNKIMAYGELLTPVADDSAHDDRVKVEYGYVSLMPTTSAEGSYPHPTKVLFLDQRLWAGDWAYSLNEAEHYSLVIGSQIAKYNDFENNYNQENEAITLDILTQFKEKVIHLVDYNGLKIMTNSYEYTYDNGAVVKQSGNGSLESCDPIVFDSLCLYCDATGNQIKAMQYEFQANLFNSSTINTLAPHDLIFYPVAMASFEDKVYSTGKYLFVTNEKKSNIPELAVCNFVPSNQANIWSRWSFATGLFNNIIDTKNNVLFLLRVDSTISGYGMEDAGDQLLVPAVLSFDGKQDCEISLTNNQVLYQSYEGLHNITVRMVLANTDIDVFSNGVYKLSTTTNNLGYITADISQLTNVTVGFRINSTIRSHPIDVGGKTKSIMKRIGKAQISVHDTEDGAITINNKTGYMNPRKDHICFYGVTGMKDEIRYTITNNNGAMFHLESLLMNIEYGTLDS